MSNIQLNITQGFNSHEELYHITNVSSEGLHITVFPKNESKRKEYAVKKIQTDLVLFKKGRESNSYGKNVTNTYAKNDFTHIDYNGEKIYFKEMVNTDNEDRITAALVVGVLTIYWK